MKYAVALLSILCAILGILLWLVHCTPPVEVEKVTVKVVEVPVERIVEVDRIVEKAVFVEVDRIVEKPVIVEVTKTIEVPVEVVVERIVEKQIPVETIVECTVYVEVMPCWRGRRR